MRRLLLPVIAFLLMSAEICPAQGSLTKTKIRVRLLNYKNGHTLRGRYIGLIISESDGNFSFHREIIRAKSDADGVAVFTFETPPPKVWILPLDDYECASEVVFSTVDILQNGIAASFADDDRCKPHTSLPTPGRGELVFPVRRLNLWQRFWRGLD